MGKVLDWWTSTTYVEYMSNSKPRPIHLRSINGGNNTKCGRGGITFSAPITDDPDKTTCKQCLHTHALIQRAHGRAS